MHIENGMFPLKAATAAVPEDMKMTRFALLAFAASAAIAGTSSAAVYLDSTNDISGAIGSQPHLDISSVEVTNTATDLLIKVSVAGDLQSTNWGKYMVGIDSVAGGDTAGNGWGRPISMSSGMDHWIAGWVDSIPAGAEFRSWTNPGWPLIKSTYSAPPNDLVAPTTTTNSVLYTIPLADLGLGNGSTFLFDVYSSGGGGGDGAVDALGNSAQSIGWWSDSYNSGSLVNSYTVVIPEPASLSLLGIGALASLRRRRA